MFWVRSWHLEFCLELTSNQLLILLDHFDGKRLYSCLIPWHVIVYRIQYVLVILIWQAAHTPFTDLQPLHQYAGWVAILKIQCLRNLSSEQHRRYLQDCYTQCSAEEAGYYDINYIPLAQACVVVCNAAQSYLTFRCSSRREQVICISWQLWAEIFNILTLHKRHNFLCIYNQHEPESNVIMRVLTLNVLSDSWVWNWISLSFLET